MDYKYIEQLLEQYWECQTTLEEESILRSFFAQDDVPARLLPYKAIFAAQKELVDEARLSDDFDRRVMQQIDARCSTHVRARRATFRQALQPFYKVAAVLAVILSLGMAAQYGRQDAQPAQMAQENYANGDSACIVPVDAATATMTQGNKDSLMLLPKP